MINKTYHLNLRLLDVVKSNRENIPNKKSDLKKAVLKEITEIKNIGTNVGFEYLFELADGTIVTDSVNLLLSGNLLSNASIAFTLGFEYNLASKKDINEIDFHVVNRDKKYLFNLKMNNLGNITSEREDI